MCIRDRSTTPPGPTAITSASCGFSCAAPGNTIPDAVVSSASNCFNTTPVSYTHLDVYKRQAPSPAAFPTESVIGSNSFGISPIAAADSFFR